MKNILTRGFTLIELLVVIAIIGVLASVVGVGLVATRGSGTDAAIVANLQNATEEAALYFVENNNSYTGICGANGIRAMVDAADEANSTDAARVADCNTSGSAWAAAATLVSNNAQYYCVDSLGAAKVVDGLITTAAGAGNFHTSTAYACP